MANNSAGFAALDAHIARLRALGSDFVRKSAPAIATAAEAETKTQLASGQSPSGKAWQPTKEGRRPLPNAGRTLTVRAIGTVILWKVTGHEALHNEGRAKGKVTRRMLPTGRLSAPVVAAIKRVLGERFGEIMGGSGGR
jgi:hypothetical protein